MTLNDLEKYLGITITAEQQPLYEARLEAAIDHVNGECNNAFTVTDESGNETIELPPVVMLGVASLVKLMGQDSGIASKTLSDMSVSYFQGEGYNTARVYWRKYIKVRVF
jgi:hypothetical protein